MIALLAKSLAILVVMLFVSMCFYAVGLLILYLIGIVLSVSRLSNVGIKLKTFVAGQVKRTRSSFKINK